MRDGRPNPDICGNIITCGEIAVGIYEIVGTKKRGLEVPKAVAEVLEHRIKQDAEAARKVNARFNGKDHAGLGSKRRIRADFACFMLPDADEMAKAVREV